MAASGLALAVLCGQSFHDSDFAVLLALFWLIAAALTSFAYFLSTLFSTSAAANNLAVLLYGAALLPG